MADDDPKIIKEDKRTGKVFNESKDYWTNINTHIKTKYEAYVDNYKNIMNINLDDDEDTSDKLKNICTYYNKDKLNFSTSFTYYINNDTSYTYIYKFADLSDGTEIKEFLNRYYSYAIKLIKDKYKDIYVPPIYDENISFEDYYNDVYDDDTDEGPAINQLKLIIKRIKTRLTTVENFKEHATILDDNVLNLFFDYLEETDLNDNIKNILSGINNKVLNNTNATYFIYVSNDIIDDVYNNIKKINKIMSPVFDLIVKSYSMQKIEITQLKEQYKKRHAEIDEDAEDDAEDDAKLIKIINDKQDKFINLFDNTIDDEINIKFYKIVKFYECLNKLIVTFEDIKYCHLPHFKSYIIIIYKLIKIYQVMTTEFVKKTLYDFNWFYSDKNDDDFIKFVATKKEQEQKPAQYSMQYMYEIIIKAIKNTLSQKINSIDDVALINISYVFDSNINDIKCLDLCKLFLSHYTDTIKLIFGINNKHIITYYSLDKIHKIINNYNKIFRQLNSSRVISNLKIKVLYDIIIFGYPSVSSADRNVTYDAQYLDILSYNMSNSKLLSNLDINDYIKYYKAVKKSCKYIIYKSFIYYIGRKANIDKQKDKDKLMDQIFTDITLYLITLIENQLAYLHNMLHMFRDIIIYKIILKNKLHNYNYNYKALTLLLRHTRLGHNKKIKLSLDDLIRTYDDKNADLSSTDSDITGAYDIITKLYKKVNKLNKFADISLIKKIIETKEPSYENIMHCFKYYSDLEESNESTLPRDKIDDFLSKKSYNDVGKAKVQAKVHFAEHQVIKDHDHDHSHMRDIITKIEKERIFKSNDIIKLNDADALLLPQPQLQQQYGGGDEYDHILKTYSNLLLGVAVITNDDDLDALINKFIMASKITLIKYRKYRAKHDDNGQNNMIDKLYSVIFKKRYTKLLSTIINEKMDETGGYIRDYPPNITHEFIDDEALFMSIFSKKLFNNDYFNSIMFKNAIIIVDFGADSNIIIDLFQALKERGNKYNLLLSWPQ